MRDRILGEGNPSQWTLLTTFATGPLPLETEVRDKVKEQQKIRDEKQTKKIEQFIFAAVCACQ